MIKVIKLIDSIYPQLGTTCREYLFKHLEIIDLKKRARLVKPGQHCDHLYFVEKGLFRCSRMKNPKEETRWFMQEGDVIASAISYFKQIPTEESIYAMEDSRLYAISREDLNVIYRQFIEFNFIGRVLTEKYYVLSMEREELVRLRKPEHRYESFLKLYPGLEKRIPAKYIASYMGIAMETLSRIKNK